MRLFPLPALCFALGVLCNIAACEAEHKFGWFVCTAAGILCFYCFLSRLCYRGG